MKIRFAFCFLLILQALSLRIEVEHDRIRAEVRNFINNRLNTLNTLQKYYWQIISHPFPLEFHAPEIKINPAMIAMQAQIEPKQNKMQIYVAKAQVIIDGIVISKPVIQKVSVNANLSNILIWIELEINACDYGNCLKIKFVKLDFDLDLVVNFPSKVLSLFSPLVSMIIMKVAKDEINALKKPKFLNSITNTLEYEFEELFPQIHDKRFIYHSSVKFAGNIKDTLVLEVDGMLTIKDFQYYPNNRRKPKIQGLTLLDHSIKPYGKDSPCYAVMSISYINRLINNLFTQMKHTEIKIPLKKTFLNWLDFFQTNDQTYLTVRIEHAPSITVIDKVVFASAVARIAYVTENARETKEIDYEMYHIRFEVRIDFREGKLVEVSHRNFEFVLLERRKTNDNEIVRLIVGLQEFIPNELVAFLVNNTFEVLKLVEIKTSQFQIVFNKLVYRETPLKIGKDVKQVEYLVGFDFSVDGLIQSISIRNVIIDALKLKVIE